jgi:hypothetical protein
MLRNVPVRGLLALGLLASCVPSRAAESSGALFDGAAGTAPSLPPLNFAPARQAAAAQTAPAPAPKRSRADLYAFTRAEAQAARKRFGLRGKRQDTAGFTFDSDVPADIQAQMLADLKFVGAIRGGAGTPLHRQIFGAVDGAVYSKFFDTRVASVGMNDCGDANAVACVIPFEDASKMWLTQNYIKFSHPQIARLMVVFHESRHTETQNDNWPHATCPTPFLDADGKDMKSIWTGASLAGEPACDVTPFGSYGSSTIMLKNIQKFCTNCTDKVKMDAGLYADDQLGRITDDGAKKQMQDDFAQ